MDADLELQGAIVQALKADPAVAALVGPRVYDTVPSNPPPQFPYISYGPSDMLEDDYDCITGQDISVQINAWSRAVGFPEVKRISDAVRAALHDADLQLAVNALVMIEHRQSRTMRDPDGLTSHAALDFAAWVERK
jgi:uncharacterized protein DUF3168